MKVLAWEAVRSNHGKESLRYVKKGVLTRIEFTYLRLGHAGVDQGISSISSEGR
jgi:hypothetical protein